MINSGKREKKPEIELPIDFSSEQINTAFQTNDLYPNTNMEPVNFLIGKSDDIVLIHPVNKNDIFPAFSRANDAAVRLLNYSKEDLQKLSFPDIVNQQQGKKLNENFRNLQKNKSAEFNLQLRTKEGRSLKAKINTGIFNIGSELHVISILKVDKEETANSHPEELNGSISTIMENVVDVICLIDSNLNFIYTNPSFNKNFGYDCFSTAGSSILQFIHPNDKDILKLKLANLVNNEKVTFVVRFRKSSGEFEWMESHAKSVIENNKLTGIVISSRSISKHIKTEERLKKLSMAIEQSQTSVVITDEKGIIEFANPSFYKLNKLDPSEAVGKSAGIIKSGKHTKEFYCDLWSTIKSGATWRGEFYNKSSDGVYYWESAVISPIKNKQGIITNYVALKNDITKSKLIQKELEKHKENLEELIKERTDELDEQNRFLKTLIDSIPNPIYVKNRRLEYRIVNKAFEDVMGLTSEDVIGSNVYSLAPIDIADLVNGKDKEVLEQEKTFVFESDYIDKDGVRKQAIIYKVPFGLSSDGPSGVLGILIDITDRKLLENQIQKSLHKERELNDLQRHIITMVSHEFRTPLTSILTASDYLELFADSINPESILKQANRIQGSVMRLTAMLDEIITLSRADRGKLNVKSQHINLFEISEKIINEARTVNSDKHLISLEYKVPDYHFIFNEEAIYLIISNLLNNAIKYSPDGGKICLIISKVNEKLIIEITDEGIGIPAEEIKLLFQPFSRASNTYSYEGHGLGLAIIKKYLDLMNGTHLIESRLNEGTHVKIMLPYKSSELDLPE
ncbi:MAG: PAS domain-containing sensor histidine kinase [Melioribacteraceae bacterium]|nr:PAS domain-containing sensor histidine kinase [Melioribacteraceae bacterium]MCF8353762.1 PAS domain-containing sensor histidine kinase [Melioribacteraceae bacterium]MCF8392428.1 PAS domain-containing sensor histidine kinase [Melioribacteraceae bacterium]